ncbi:MAG: resolvase [Methanobacterium sp.]|nr:resolvase [Methanobacterium sp.]
MTQGRFVAYLRVSTEAQGRSGLGLEAQREAVRQFLNGGAWELLAEFVEVERGKKDDRPKLAEALHLCKLTGAKLVIAKLDRLSRDAHFLLGLQKEGAQFVAADMPDANELTVGIMALVAQQERKAISERTKAALAAAKARGTKLGNPNGARHLQGYGNGAAIAAVKANADTLARSLREIVLPLQASGTSLRGIADALNAQGILTPRHGQWHASSVGRLLGRLTSTGQ